MKQKDSNKAQYVWHEYTKNMFLSNKSKIWSFFNKKRLDLTNKYVTKYLKRGNVLDIGSYDGFVIYDLLKNKSLIKVNEINFLDLYNDSKSEVLGMIKNNQKIFQKKYPKMNFNIIKKTAEEITEKEKYDNVFVFETLEHVENEEKVIENISKALKTNGLLFVTYPVEFGFMFFFKDLGRRFITRKSYHPIKELFYGLIGKTSKIKRTPRGHKGYDYRNTIKLIEKNGLKKIKNKYYPINNNRLAYGGSVVFKKIIRT